jgi:DNA-directed RNA polymerase specialized sigma24 family protein
MTCPASSDTVRFSADRGLGGVKRPGIRGGSRSPWRCARSVRAALNILRRDPCTGPAVSAALGSIAADSRRWRVVGLMGVIRPVERDEFELFVAQVRPRLLQALVASYGPVDGREACVDALSWAWEHSDRLDEIDHPVAYLYRVGQSATRRFVPKPIPASFVELLGGEFPEVEPELLPALSRLPEQQRIVVVLVHGYGWRQAEVARLLNVNPSTIRDYLNRALDRLRRELEVSDVH